MVILRSFLAALLSILRSRAALELEILALRHQTGVLQGSAAKRPKLTLWFAKTSAEAQNGAVPGEVGSRLSVRYSKKTLEGGQPACAWVAHTHIYIYRTGGKSIRTMPLDCNDGAALRVAPVKGLDPKFPSKFRPIQEQDKQR